MGRATEPLGSLTLVLPVHNEVENLRWLLPHIAATLPTIARQFSVVVVDDGSSDGSGQEAQALSATLGLELTVLRHATKRGYGATVGDGLRAANFDFVAFTDADGQFDVADLNLLVPFLDGADLVGGWREHRSDAWPRKLVSGVFNALVMILYQLPYRDVDCALKLMRREVLGSFDLDARSALINTELYYKARRAGWRIAQCAVPHHPRTAGRRSGARPRAIARAIKELVVLRWRVARSPRHRPAI
jgi:glycosyltransferase involved in cell wall biosynthesis